MTDTLVGMPAPSEPPTVAYGTGLSVSIEPGRPLRLSTMPWNFPERPDLIALADRRARLDFLRDHLKSLCGLWDKLPRLFLDAYFRDVAECIRRDRSAIDVLAAVHGGLFDPEDWSFSALCPLPQARLPAAPEAPVDFAFWAGTEPHAVFILGATSPNRAQREGRERLRDGGIHVTEIPLVELERAAPGELMAPLGDRFTDFWKDVPLPSSPFRIGALDEILSA
ncbi:MAG TPA: hypothetical protein VKU84_16725 [Stellaceae bacterium]|nr:hypothetical protein [Stellaceae bacterium]